MNTDSPEYKAEITKRLQDKGVSPTQQRLEIAQILFARPQHLSAEEVLNIVNAQAPLVSKATVYNTLGLFARKGLVREVIVDPTKVFYDSNTTEHHHFYNRFFYGVLIDHDWSFFHGALLAMTSPSAHSFSSARRTQ